MGTVSGLQVISLDEFIPRKVIVKETDPNSSEILWQTPGGISCFDVLESSNLIAIVAGGKMPKFDPSKVVLYDLFKSEILAEFEFSSPVKSVFLRRNLLIVLFTTKILIYNVQLPACKKVYEFDMYWNEFSAFDITLGGEVIAFPSRNKGQLQTVDITSLHIVPFTSISSGHDHAISCISLSKDGNYVATCSTKGTLIRIWHAKSASLKHELRRGADEAEIYSMDFDKSSTKLVVSSDKGTVHIFNLELEQEKQPTLVSSYLPKYFSSDWSFSHCQMPYLSRSLVKFVDSDEEYRSQNSIVVVSDEGSIYTLGFDVAPGGECLITSHHRFLQ